MGSERYEHGSALVEGRSWEGIRQDLHEVPGTSGTGPYPVPGNIRWHENTGRAALLGSRPGVPGAFKAGVVCHGAEGRRGLPRGRGRSSWCESVEADRVRTRAHTEVVNGDKNGREQSQRRLGPRVYPVTGMLRTAVDLPERVRGRKCAAYRGF